jgi:hypothetical protein
MMKMNDMKKYLVIISMLLMAICLGLTVDVQSQSAAKVENINFYAEGTKLIVTYDIVKAKPDETFDVWIKIVTASGKEISPITMTGNIGSGNTGGTGKKISWDVEADRMTLDEEFSVEVFARPEKKEEVKVQEKEKTAPIVIPVAAGSLKAADVFLPEKNTFYWLGVDYSHVKMQVELEPEVVKNQYFAAWNKLLLDEADKYNFKRMLKLKAIQNDISVITSINAQVNTSDMKATSAPDYSIGAITSFVNSYPSFGLNGIGIVFIAEFLNKQQKEGYYHVVAFNLANNEVLLVEKMRGEPGGAGFRNYWAGSILAVIEQFEKQYKDLKIKYSK